MWWMATSHHNNQPLSLQGLGTKFQTIWIRALKLGEYKAKSSNFNNVEGLDFNTFPTKVEDKMGNEYKPITSTNKSIRRLSQEKECHP